MKKLLLWGVALIALAVGPANAADLGRPLPAPTPVPVPAYMPFSWTGFYIGGNAGVAWSPKGEFTDSFGNFFDGASQSTVFTGGGQVGGNYQINYWLVVGVEADFNWLSDHNNKSNGVFIPAVGGNVQVAADSTWITILAARVGVVAAERALFYVKGGGGWLSDNQFTVTNTTSGASFSGTNNNFNGGWLVGAGIEYAFALNWTAKVEYDFLAISNTSFTVPAGTLGFPSSDTFTTNNRDLQMLTVGFNYLFNGF
ncbi:MAG: outer membrane beta-barrel protein [Xanthobacteraceae bacterium]